MLQFLLTEFAEWQITIIVLARDLVNGVGDVVRDAGNGLRDAGQAVKNAADRDM